VHVFTAFNYTVKTSGATGYAVVAAHTRAPLMKETKPDTTLPTGNARVYYLGPGEFYFTTSEGFMTLEGTRIPDGEFDGFKAERHANLYRFTREALAAIELDTVTTLNTMTWLTNLDVDDLTLEAHYAGTDKGAYGYGGIKDPSSYVKDRYGKAVTTWSRVTLGMQNFKMSVFGSNQGGNCVLVAITRILKYYRDQGYTKIDSDIQKIYKKVLARAKKHNWNKDVGTVPTVIDDFMRGVLADYGYKKSPADNDYIWSFHSEIKNEVKAGRPLLMNIGGGYYSSHTVTIAGHGTYTSKWKSGSNSYSQAHNMIAIYDGWEAGMRYIDYEAFTYDLFSVASLTISSKPKA
jgi:hypothetical protein